MLGFRSVFGNHVGDFELCIVKIKITTNPLTKKNEDFFKSIIYRAHGDNYELFGPDEAIKRKFDLQGNEKIAVYLSKFSHGMREKVATFQYKILPNGESLIDETDEGITFNSEDNLIIYDRRNIFSPQEKEWPSWLKTNYKESGSMNDPTNPYGKSIFRWGNIRAGCEEILGGSCQLEDGPRGLEDIFNYPVFENMLNISNY